MSDVPVPAVGDVVEVDVGPVAHGGHCVARVGGEGVVVFVRHALPGEKVRARVTEIGTQGRYLRADAVEVLSASADRVEAPCPFAGPGLCGGCDWQHADLAAQRRLKSEVVVEQLRRLGGLSTEEIERLGVACEPVPGDEDGLRWRTRVEFAVGRSQTARTRSAAPDAGPDAAGPGAAAPGAVAPDAGPDAAGPGAAAPGAVAPDGVAPGAVAPDAAGTTAVGPGAVTVGLRAHRSHDVVPLDDCLIATRGVVGTGVLEEPPAAGIVALDVVAPSVGDPVVVPLTLPDPHRRRGRRRDGRRAASRRGTRQTPRPVGPVPEVTERVVTVSDLPSAATEEAEATTERATTERATTEEAATEGAATDRAYTLSARGFWQVHPGAASTFTQQVLGWLAPQPGERALDLYSGVGLFAAPLAHAVGAQGSVLAVEADAEATRAAGRHLAAYPWARASAEPTERALQRLVTEEERVDIVVLDPPRTGAGRSVVEAISALRPRAVVYVACDPAALARDVATAREVGLELEALRVLDAFPMTHHMECLALLRPVG